MNEFDANEFDAKLASIDSEEKLMVLAQAFWDVWPELANVYSFEEVITKCGQFVMARRLGAEPQELGGDDA